MYFFIFPSFHFVFCFIPIHFVDEVKIKRAADGSC